MRAEASAKVSFGEQEVRKYVVGSPPLSDKFAKSVSKEVLLPEGAPPLGEEDVKRMIPGLLTPSVQSGPDSWTFLLLQPLRCLLTSSLTLQSVSWVRWLRMTNSLLNFLLNSRSLRKRQFEDKLGWFQRQISEEAFFPFV